MLSIPMGNETSAKSPFLYRLLWGIVIVLLITNVSLIVVLVGTQSFSSTVHVDLKSPFAATVAIDDTFAIPIKTAIPVKTTVNVPGVIPILGQAVTLTIPIDTTVPIVTTVSIPIKKSVPVSISSPLSFYRKKGS